MCMCMCMCVCMCARGVSSPPRSLQLFPQQHQLKTSGGPLSALTCCVNARLLSAIKKISPLIYSQSWVGSWVYTTHYDDFHPDILARMYT